ANGAGGVDGEGESGAELVVVGCQAGPGPELGARNVILGTYAFLSSSDHFHLRPMKTPIHPANAAPPVAPYTPAILANGTLYLSGQIALDAEGNLHTGDIIVETRRVMDNIGNLLEAAGMGYEHLVKVT